MASTSEVGHAKNVANFQKLISFCEGYGDDYNPVKPEIMLPDLQSLYANAQSEIDLCIAAKNSYDAATVKRKNIFKSLKTTATKVINAIAVTDAEKETIEDARVINRKIQGARSTKPTAQSGTENPEDSKAVSVSRQSFTSYVENFSALVDLASSIPDYAPNEQHLMITTLKAFIAEMQASNAEVNAAEVAYSNARISRNKVLYAEKSGLVETAVRVKKYVKSVFGVSSPRYKQISGILFKYPNE